jgi:DNA-binding NtrC family response regulator
MVGFMDSLKNDKLLDLIKKFEIKLPPLILEDRIVQNVLILDSDEESSNELKDILQNLGFGVFLCKTIDNARKLIKSINNLSLIISVPRPGGAKEPTGISFLSEIKYKNPKIISILAVSFTESEDAVGALRKNILGFFIKPYKKEEIIQSLSKLLYLFNKHDYLKKIIQDFFSDIKNNI